MNEAPYTHRELQQLGEWIDRDGNNAADCQHDVRIELVAGVPLVVCVKCGKPAEEIYRAVQDGRPRSNHG